MLTRGAAARTTATTATTAVANQSPSLFHTTHPHSNSQEGMIERLRLKIANAHVFKLPPSPSGGWRGADWREKVWQGTLKVVERGEETAVLLVDTREERNIFAVCPIRHNLDDKNNIGNGVERCIDSSRYFVLRIENAQGRRMLIGMAFNERNDAFDFNTALEDSRREKEGERRVALGMVSSAAEGVDYTMKEGEKMRVSLPRIPGGSEEDTTPGQARDGVSTSRREAQRARRAAPGNTARGGFLKPSSKDTPSRLA